MIIIILVYLISDINETFIPERDKTIWYGYDVRDDDIFREIKTYENTVNEYGIERCLKECEGGCVEYGVSGVAYCFPKEKKN
jgi:phage pi2 protein 07